VNNDISDLKLLAKHQGKNVEIISNIILDDPKFSTWWGGLKGQHHDFVGGLAKHTKEVVDLSFNSLVVLNIDDVDNTELFFSVLFHDAGKMYDYERVTDELFIATPHKRLIHHISRSALIWSHAIKNDEELNHKYHDLVLHNILSHHGHREWGSPVAPKTRAAWLLHLSDAISARMNDCDRLDLAVPKK